MGLKSIFDGLYVDQLIQKNERGEFIVYPSGMIGRGYRLPPEHESTIRQRLRMLMLISLIAGTSFGIFLLRIVQSPSPMSPLGWVLIAGLAVLLFGAIFYAQSRLTAGLEPVAGPRPSPRQWLRGARAMRPAWTYWLCVIGGGLLALAAIAAIVVGITDGDWLVTASGAFLLAISVLCGVDGVLALRQRAPSQ